MTVRTDTPSASAASSTENPPKNRSSTTWLGRGSIIASSAKASFKATTSTPGAGAATSAASSDKHSTRLTALGRLSCTRGVDQDATHHPGGGRQRSGRGSASAPRASRAAGRRTPARGPLVATPMARCSPESRRRAIPRSSRCTSGASCSTAFRVTVAPRPQQTGHVGGLVHARSLFGQMKKAPMFVLRDTVTSATR